jgi:hypothetical protein
METIDTRILHLIEADGYKVTVRSNRCDEQVEYCFEVEGFNDWLFGMWIRPISETEYLISLFGDKKKNINFFTPRHSAFSITDVYSYDSKTTDTWYADSFVNTLQMIKNAGLFGRWIFSKKAHETGIIKYILKSLLTWKKK